jgi:Flp pilus assembly protein TadG
MKYAKALGLALYRLCRADCGASLLEFAVVLPVLTLLTLGVADYSRVFFAAIKVANAAEAGALYGARSNATSRDTMNIRIIAQNDAGDTGGAMTVSSQQFCECAGAAVNCSSSCNTYADRIPASFVQVTTRKGVAMLIRYPGLPRSINVAHTATFRVQSN